MKFHTEIPHPDDPTRYKERHIIPARNAEHAAKMERDLRLLRLEYLRKKKRVLIP